MGAYVEIVDTAQRFLHNNQNLKVGIGIAANAGKPFGDHGKDTHKIHQVGGKTNIHKAGANTNIGFKEEHLSGGGQEESLIASARLALAQKGIPEEGVVTQLFSYKDSSGKPAWGLKNSNGDLIQGGNYKNYTLKTLAEGQMGEPYIHHAKMHVTSISGKPKQTDLLFAYSPNYTATRGPDTSTGLTQVLDFRQSINKANNLITEDKKNIETLQKDVYRGILREILKKDLKLDAVCLPIFGSNIYSKQHVGSGKFRDTELSQFIIDGTQDWFKAVLKEGEFKNKFNDTAFLFTSPDGQEMKDVGDYTKKEYAYNLYKNANNTNLNPQDQKYWKDRYNDYEQEEIKYRKRKDPSINPTKVKNTILADWENVKKQRVKYLDSNFSSQKPIQQQTPNPNIQPKRPEITTKVGHSRFIYRVKK